MDTEVLNDDGLSTIAETVRIFKSSTSSVYRMIEKKQLDARKFGDATRITNRSIKAAIANAPPLVIRRHKRAA